MHDDTRDHGPQPLDGLMTRWGLTNHQLVQSSIEQLNHKQVQKARKGRQLSLHLMLKLTGTLNAAILARLPKQARAGFTPYLHKHLFNYAKGHDAAWVDSNMIPSAGDFPVCDDPRKENDQPAKERKE